MPGPQVEVRQWHLEHARELCSVTENWVQCEHVSVDWKVATRNTTSCVCVGKRYVVAVCCIVVASLTTIQG